MWEHVKLLEILERNQHCINVGMKDILCTLVTTQRELRAAYKIRHEIFVKEQKLFSSSDRDAYDCPAIHIVALLENEVVGTVRVYEETVAYGLGADLLCASPLEAG